MLPAPFAALAAVSGAVFCAAAPRTPKSTISCLFWVGSAFSGLGLSQSSSWPLLTLIRLSPPNTHCTPSVQNESPSRRHAPGTVGLAFALFGSQAGRGEVVYVTSSHTPSRWTLLPEPATRLTE